jgi:hypothetical protein
MSSWAACEGFLPDDEALGATEARVLALVSEQSHAVYAQAAGRLAERPGAGVARTPGLAPRVERSSVRAGASVAQRRPRTFDGAATVVSVSTIAIEG